MICSWRTEVDTVSGICNIVIGNIPESLDSYEEGELLRLKPLRCLLTHLDMPIQVSIHRNMRLPGAVLMVLFEYLFPPGNKARVEKLRVKNFILPDEASPGSFFYLLNERLPRLRELDFQQASCITPKTGKQVGIGHLARHPSLEKLSMNCLDPTYGHENQTRHLMPEFCGALSPTSRVSHLSFLASNRDRWAETGIWDLLKGENHNIRSIHLVIFSDADILQDVLSTRVRDIRIEPMHDLVTSMITTLAALNQCETTTTKSLTIDAKPWLKHSWSQRKLVPEATTTQIRQVLQSIVENKRATSLTEFNIRNYDYEFDTTGTGLQPMVDFMRGFCFGNKWLLEDVDLATNDEFLNGLASLGQQDDLSSVLYVVNRCFERIIPSFCAAAKSNLAIKSNGAKYLPCI